jgi:hypothetical protein
VVGPRCHNHDQSAICCHISSNQQPLVLSDSNLQHLEAASPLIIAVLTQACSLGAPLPVKVEVVVVSEVAGGHGKAQPS